MVEKELEVGIDPDDVRNIRYMISSIGFWIQAVRSDVGCSYGTSIETAAVFDDHELDCKSWGWLQ